MNLENELTSRQKLHSSQPLYSVQSPLQRSLLLTNQFSAEAHNDDMCVLLVIMT